MRWLYISELVESGTMERFLDLRFDLQSLGKTKSVSESVVWVNDLRSTGQETSNLFIYQARESSLVPVGFLLAEFLHKL